MLVWEELENVLVGVTTFVTAAVGGGDDIILWTSLIPPPMLPWESRGDDFC